MIHIVTYPRMRSELGEAQRDAEFDTYPGVRSPNRKPRGTRPDSGAQEPADPRRQGGGGAAGDNPVRTKVKAATAGAIPGGLLGQYVLSLLEDRYGAFAAGYYKRDGLSPPS